MIDFTDLLTAFGEHFMLTAVICVELALGAILVGVALSGRRAKSSQPAAKGAERILLQELGRREDEVCVVMRCRDMMPVSAVGDLERLLGVSLERLQTDVTALETQVQDPELGKRIWQQYRAWDGGTPISEDFRLKNGEWVRMDITRAPNGAYDLFSFRCVTASHEQIAQYEKRLVKAEEESQSKTTFLSRMSHEIRTPMNGIIGMLQLAEGRLSENHPALQYLTKADELSGHLLALINDILDMSRIEAGKVELEEKPFSLHELGSKLYDMFAKNLDARGVRYEVNFEEVTVDCVIGDELRISQVIINFLSNAVKFTSEGEIIVTFRQMMLHDGVADLMIRVHDTGIGMAPEFVERIFRPFEQESIDTAKNYGGTGLGMAITDQLVRLMGGEIVVESRKGVGSDFSVFLHLPLADESQTAVEIPAMQSERTAEDDDAFRGRRILMAEDNELNAMIAEEVLGEMGAEVETVGDGRSAVEAFSAHPAGYYDFILMDVQMPVLDGRSAAREIRALSRPDAQDILIFALSADAFVEDERLSAESGMNGHFAKPVDFAALQHDIGAFLRRREEKESVR